MWVAKAHGLSLHPDVGCKAHPRQLRERPGRSIARPAVAERRLTVMAQGKVVCLLKTPSVVHVPMMCTPLLLQKRSRGVMDRNSARRGAGAPGPDQADAAPHA
jgi:hypothetical protein